MHNGSGSWTKVPLVLLTLSVHFVNKKKIELHQTGILFIFSTNLLDLKKISVAALLKSLRGRRLWLIAKIVKVCQTFSSKVDH